MASYYPNNCELDIPIHSCDPCADKEFGRVRAAAFIHKDYIADVQADPTSSAVWTTGINNGNIIIIPSTNGEVPEASELVGDGYGEAVEELLGYDYTASYSDPDYKENCDHYNALKASNNFHFAYKTSNSVHITPVTVTIIPKQPVDNDLTSRVRWLVQVKWRSNDLVCPTDIPEGIFTCYIPDPV